jgi:hypothetical protein
MPRPAIGFGRHGLDAALGESRAESNRRRYRDDLGPEGADDRVDPTVAPTVSEHARV